MNKLLTRSFQAVARPAAYALDWREPELLIGGVVLSVYQRI